MKKSAITSGGASVIKDLIGTPTRRGHPFVPTKGCKNGLGLRPKDPTLVGRNLRLSRADPMLCFGQPSPLQCILLSPQGLATLWGPLLPRPESQSDGFPERD